MIVAWTSARSWAGCKILAQHQEMTMQMVPDQYTGTANFAESLRGESTI